jgi:stage V sporulation protein S
LVNIQEHDMAPSDHNSEEHILKVGASSSAQALASALSHAVYDGKKVVLRAIGAGAVNQAVKAVAIAQSFVGQRGISLVIRPGFTSVDMPDSDKPVSAIILKVIPT